MNEYGVNGGVSQGYNPGGQSFSAPYGVYGGGNPTFVGAGKNLFSPFTPNPNWGNPVMQNDPSYQSLATKPFDAAAWVGQRILMGGAIDIAANKMFSNMSQKIAGNFTSGVMRGLGGGAMMQSGAGMLGGFAGSFLGPLAIGQAAYTTMDSGVFQPYIRSNRGANNLYNNFANSTFETGGNVISGRGMSRGGAARTATGIDRAGIQDYSLSASDYHDIASMSARSGLLDDVKSSQITSQVAGIAKQVKLILSLSKDPSIQNAVQELSRLHMMGASVTGGINSVASRAYSTIAGNAAAAGMSVQDMMNGPGAQGQYMFGASGLTPVLGQIAASNVMAGFKSAQRAGILSPGQIARMGGLDMATQSALSAQIQGATSVYGQMNNYNRFNGGGSPTTVGTLANFSGAFSRNPIDVMGKQVLYGDEYASKALSQDGGTGPEKDAIRLLKEMGRTPDTPGGYSPEQIAFAMTQMGYDNKTIRAYIASRKAATDPKSQALRQKSLRASYIESTAQSVSQEMGYDSAVGAVGRGIQDAWKSTVGFLADNAGHPMAEAYGDTIDWVADAAHTLIFGKNSTYKKPLSTKKIVNAPFGANTASRGLIDELNKESLKDGPQGDKARDILSGKLEGKDLKLALAKFGANSSNSNVKRGLEVNGRALEEVAGHIQNNGVVDTATEDSNYGDMSSVERDNLIPTLKAYGQAADLLSQVDGEETTVESRLSDLLADPKYKELSKYLISDSAIPLDQNANNMEVAVRSLKKLAAQSQNRGLSAAAKMAVQGKSKEEIFKTLGGYYQSGARIAPGADTKAFASVNKDVQASVDGANANAKTGSSNGANYAGYKDNGELGDFSEELEKTTSQLSKLSASARKVKLEKGGKSKYTPTSYSPIDTETSGEMSLYQ